MLFLLALPGAAERLELVNADLLKDESIDAAVQGCDFVLHIASPYVLTAVDPQKELVDPAVNGTLSVLKAALKYGETVKKVVLTSSCAAVLEYPESSTRVYDEKDWNTTSSLTQSPYYYSKVAAERAAVDFVEKNKDHQPPCFKLVVANPFVIFGPSLSKKPNTSTDIVKNLMTGVYPAKIDLNWAIVDVRDVALLHILLMEDPNAQGRHIMCNPSKSLNEMTEIIRSKYPNARLPSHDLSGGIGTAFTKVAAHFQKPSAKEYLLHNLGMIPVLNNKKSLTIAGFKGYMPVQATILDTAEDLVESGIVQVNK